MNDYLLLFSAGLLSALHCVGMCGGFIAACGMKYGGGASFSLTYNAGRVFSYTILGAIMGLLGKALIAAGLFGKFQGIVPIIAGMMMILIGLDLLGYVPKRVGRSTAGLFPKMLSDKLIGGQLKKKSAPFILGMLNGLIPCGLLYAVGVKAAATADPFQGMLTVLVFGAGTLPALLLAGSFSGITSKLRSGFLLNVSYIIIVLLGIRSVSNGVEYLRIHLSL